MSQTSFEGRCACGRLQFTVARLGFGIINCHCEDCLRLHGNYNAMVAVSPADLTYRSDGTLTYYRTSETAQRAFCSVCGSQIAKVPDDGEVVLVSAGALQGPLGLKTRKNVWTEDAPDWYDVPTA